MGARTDRAVEVPAQLGVDVGDAPDRVPDLGRDRLARPLGGGAAECPGRAAGPDGTTQLGEQALPLVGDPTLPGDVAAGPRRLVVQFGQPPR